MAEKKWISEFLFCHINGSCRNIEFVNCQLILLQKHFMQLKALNNKKKLLIPSRISTKLFNKIQIIGKPVFNEIILFKELSEIKNWG